jgi:hypothetical protein
MKAMFLLCGQKSIAELRLPIFSLLLKDSGDKNEICVLIYAIEGDYSVMVF